MAYLTNWSNPNDAAYQLWQARTEWIETKLNELKTYTQDTNGLDELFTAIASQLGIPLTQNIVELYEYLEAGNDISSTLDELNLSNGGFLYLVRVRNLLANDNPVLSSEWEEVYNIFLQAFKIGQFQTWRDRERDNRVILSPDSFQIPVPPPLEFPPPEPKPLPEWRATQQAIRTWKNKLKSRIDREQTIKEGLQIAISATEEATLLLLRDALIMAMDVEGNNLNAKADWIAKNLLIDAQAGSCQETTRIAQAIETIQGLLWGLKINQFRETYPNLELGDRETFDEKWKWLGSYANWRSAMLVFLYPENILRPELRKYQTPAFRQLVKNVRNNRRINPDRACQEAKAYSDYFADIARLKVEATCQTRTRIHSGDCRDRTATTYSNLFHMFARGGKTNTVYWSTYNSGDRSNYAQSFWTPLPAIEKAINIIGAVPYKISSQERYIYLFVRTQEADVQELVYLRYDLEKGNWDSNPKPLGIPEEATRFTAVAKQNIIETDPPHLAIRLNNSTIYARQLNRTGDDWQGEGGNPLINPDESPLYSKICSMVEVARGKWFLVVQRTNRRLACKLFGSDSPSNWLNIGNVNSSFRGAFSFPRDRTFDMYVYWKQGESICYQAIKRSSSNSNTISGLASEKDPQDSSQTFLDQWLKDNTDINLENYRVPDNIGLTKGYEGNTLLKFFSYNQQFDPAEDDISDLGLRKKRYCADVGKVVGYINQLIRANDTLWKSAASVFSSSTINHNFLTAAIENFSICKYDLDLDDCSSIELYPSLSKSKVFQLQLGDIFIAPTFTHFQEPVISQNPLINLNINGRNEEPISPTIQWNEKYFAYQQITGITGLYRCTFNRPFKPSNDDDSDRLSIVSPKPIAPRINGNLYISEQISEAELHSRREEIRNVYEDNPQISQTNRTYLYEAYYFVPIFLALKLQQQRYYQAALNYYRTVYAYNLTIDNSQPTEPKDQTKIYYGLKLEESLPEVYQRAEDWLLDPLNPHLIAASRRNTYTRFTLLSIIRCFLEYADNEFTRDTAESVPRARTLYLTALELFDRLEQQERNCQQLIDSLDTEISNQLKIDALELLPVWHQIKRSLLEIKDEEILNNVVQQIETAIASEQSWITKLITAQTIIDQAFNSLPPAPNFQKLLEGKKQKSERIYAALLTQAEVSNALTKVGDIVAKDYLNAVSFISGITTQALETEKIQLPWLGQKTMVTAANNGSLTSTQTLIREDYQRLASYNPEAPSHKERSQIQVDHYQDLLDEGKSNYEIAALRLLAYSLTQADSVSFGLTGGVSFSPSGKFQTLANISSTLASYERRKQEWQFQEKLAQQDVRLGEQQIRIAQDRVRVVGQERVISQMQADFAEETLDFLTNKFGNAELYDWMVGILEGVYSFFLQQATATAKLAEDQLAFERQEVSPSYIQADYWEVPNDNFSTSQNNNTPDRRGLTGSARLLQDIYQLDQYAFDTDQRKLQLTKTISLARLAPAEFQGFRETGVIEFDTSIKLFDRDFPGHYLRLIKRVRTSIIALIPPIEGIKATLSTTGLSRVVTGQNNLFQTNEIVRPPESVALTSPRDATGLFELTPQSQEMLLPFENFGVDTSWELRLPKGSNLFDYSTIADVLITLEYTALNSFTYRQTVLDELGNTISGDRPFSFRNQFADAWYDLNNPDQTDNPMTVTFETTREDFPANIEELKIDELVLYFALTEGEMFKVPITLSFTEQNTTNPVGGSATPIDGVISTRRGKSSAWGSITEAAKTPAGKWVLALPTDTTKILFEEEAIEDILFVITYSGRIPQ